jgi:hypothetical protein
MLLLLLRMPHDRQLLCWHWPGQQPAWLLRLTAHQVQNSNPHKLLRQLLCRPNTLLTPFSPLHLYIL